MYRNSIIQVNKWAGLMIVQGFTINLNLAYRGNESSMKQLEKLKKF